MAELQLVSVPSFSRLSWLRHSFSTRLGGRSSVYGGATLNLGWTKEDSPENVGANRQAFVAAVGGGTGAMKLVTIRQVHGNEVVEVGAEALAGELETEEGKALLEADGLVTDTPGVLIAAGTADCVPVLIVDPVHRAVAALHAGWRGTVAGIAGKGVARLQERYGSRPENLIAAVGPSIGACCYAVGEEVREQFRAAFGYGEELFHEAGSVGGLDEGSLFIDLWEANRRQLLDAGVQMEQLSVVGDCTGCARTATGERRYFSHRMERGHAGRMLNAIGIAAID